MIVSVIFTILSILLYTPNNSYTNVVLYLNYYNACYISNKQLYFVWLYILFYIGKYLVHITHVRFSVITKNQWELTEYYKSIVKIFFSQIIFLGYYVFLGPYAPRSRLFKHYDIHYLFQAFAMQNMQTTQSAFRFSALQSTRFAAFPMRHMRELQ